MYADVAWIPLALNAATTLIVQSKLTADGGCMAEIMCVVITGVNSSRMCISGGDKTAVADNCLKSVTQDKRISLYSVIDNFAF